MEVQEEALEGAVQDAVEEVLQWVQISALVDHLQEEMECPC